MIEANSSPAGAPATGLSRTLRGRHLMMISIGGIVGGGLFVGSSTSIRAAGPAAFLSYALTGLIILLIMRMLSEMAASSPHARSFTEYARAGLGDAAGFVTGWLYWYVWVMTVPIEAIAGATILQRWIPLSQFQLGLALMSVMTIVNLQSARSYAEFEFWFASIKVTAIIAFILLAASYAFGWTAPLVSGMHRATFANLTDHGGFAPHGWIAVLGAVPTAFFSMTGAEITTIAAVESEHSSEAVARMSSLVIWRILFFYVVSLFFIVSVSPWSDVRSGESPFTRALTTMQIPWADSVMRFIILTAVLSCLNSAFYVSSRILFVLGERADAPASMIRLNSRHVPMGSVLAGSAAGFLGVAGKHVLAAAGVHRDRLRRDRPHLRDRQWRHRFVRGIGARVFRCHGRVHDEGDGGGAADGGAGRHRRRRAVRRGQRTRHRALPAAVLRLDARHVLYRARVGRVDGGGAATVRLLREF